MKQVHLTVMPVRWGDLNAFGHVNNTPGAVCRRIVRHVVLGPPSNKARDAVETGRLVKERNAVRGRPKDNPEGAQPLRHMAALDLLA